MKMTRGIRFVASSPVDDGDALAGLGDLHVGAIGRRNVDSYGGAEERSRWRSGFARNLLNLTPTLSHRQGAR